jgi:hypothetical protein
MSRRCSFPEELPVDSQNDPEEVVPSVRAHLPPAFLGSGAARGGSTPQHELQALHLLRPGDSTCVF